MIYKGKLLLLSIFCLPLFTSSSPAGSRGHEVDFTTRQSDGGAPWWHNPCGPQHGHHFRHHHKKSEGHNCTKPRNIQKNILRPLIQQLKKFRDVYTHQSLLIEKYYNKDRNCIQLKKEQYNYEWLPKKPRVKNFKNKQKEALLQFHKEIQIFAVALDKLKETIGPSKINVTERNSFIHKISMEMRLVMCELETLVNNTCRNIVVERIRTDYIDKYANSWTSSTDLTQMCTQDRGVLTAYRDFIFGWKHVFRNIKRNEMNASMSSSSNEDENVEKNVI